MSYLNAHASPKPSATPLFKPGKYYFDPRLTGDAASDQVPGLRSKDTRFDSRPGSISESIPLRTLSTRDAPRLASTSYPSGDSLKNAPSDTYFDRRASSNLRASIAQLEFLIHEAARLAENASTHEKKEDLDYDQQTSHMKLSEYDQPTLECGEIVQRVKDQEEVMSARSSVLESGRLAKHSVQSFMSLPGVKPVTLLPPILTGPESRSVENVAWTPSVPCRDHKYRLHDIEEHLHDGICPESKSPSEICPVVRSPNLHPTVPIEKRRRSSTKHDSSSPAEPRLPVRDPNNPIPTATSETPQSNQVSGPRVHFSDQSLASEQHDSTGPRRWRKPSAAPPAFRCPQNTPATPASDPNSSEEPSPGHNDSHDFTLFDEPLPVEEPTAPTLLVNGAEVDDWDTILAVNSHKPHRIKTGHERHFSTIFGISSSQAPRTMSVALNNLEAGLKAPVIDLRRKSHVDVYHEGETFDVHETCEHSTIARNWSTSKKRFTAFVACLNTACIGLVLGIYAGEVPAIQYAIADFGHFTILGNVFMYCGLATSSFIFWPLPLIHGRKPYMIVANLVALALQIPQGLAVNGYRDPSTITYKTLLLASRGVAGLVLGLLDMNLKTMMLDCFGASLQSQALGDDLHDSYDVRKHGGGMGMWLGFSSWSTVGPISIGFMAGASIIDRGASVSWGFWIALCLLLIALLLTIVTPEVRRAAFRRTVEEMTGQEGRFSRVSRGEIKMHLDGTGPYWWGEEVFAGIRLCGKMARQPGFLLLSLYTAWMYAQYSLVLMLLGSLTSKSYHYEATWVGLCTLAPAFGAILAAPFQRGSYFSRARITPVRTDSFTVKKHFNWSSHFVRRLLFMILLPLCVAAYAAASLGPPLLITAPCVMAGLVGFFTTMATAECFGLIMETFDTTDLQPGMTGRPIRGSLDRELARQRTNFSCYPRVSAGFAITQALSFLLAAAATAVCGTVQRREGTVWTTTGVALISFVLTLLLSAVLVKWKQVQMIPNGPETIEHLRRADTSWRPIIVGRPSGKFRRLSIFEMGRMTRYSQIRERNRLEENLSGGGRMWT